MKIVGWSLTQVSSLRLKPFGEFDSNWINTIKVSRLIIQIK
jgi:hypothetical protein